MRVNGGLAAHFKVPNGPSRPGVHWAIGLKRGEKTHKVTVKALFAEDATPETHKNQEYQAQVVMQYPKPGSGCSFQPDPDFATTVLQKIMANGG